NRVLVTKPQNKIPYELLHGRTPSIGFMRPFGCPVTILNTLDSLSKFHEKVDEIFLVGYSVSSKAFRNTDGDAAFDEKEPEFEGRKPQSEVYVSPSGSAQTKKHDDKNKREAKGKSPVETMMKMLPLMEITYFDANKPKSEVILFPSSSAQSRKKDGKTKKEAKGKNMLELEDVTYYDDEDVVGAEADFNNLESSILFSPILITRIHKDHLVSQIIGDLSLTTQTRSMTRAVKDQGFEDPNHPDKVYKVVKVLYGLHQAPRAWYETFATYLLENGFQRGTMDQTLFFKNQKRDIMLVQIYVDDIIFGATNKYLRKSFEKLMKDKFQMSSMGELTFFLGLKVKQKKDGIFISQDKYVAEILRKFRLTEGKSASTPIDTEKPLLKDLDGEDVDVHTYSSAQSKEQDDKTKKEDKGKSHVESVTGYRDLNAEFQDCSENSSNEVNAASSTILTIGKNSLNSTNTFSAAGPSNTVDIIYSDNEDVVGAKADFNNLESSILISPIPTTRIHKDHPVSQIIGDLSSTTQTRSMIRAVKDQGGLSQIFGNGFHTCMFACFLSQKEPKRVHQALKDPSWIKAVQEELLQFKMQKV
nr:putative ribonuclease H-like domain-containing protein [Tanacetum cinerariifolium]